MELQEFFSFKSFAILALTVFIALHIFSLFGYQRDHGTLSYSRGLDTEKKMLVQKDSNANSRTFTLEDLAICNGVSSDDVKVNAQGFNSKQILLCVNGEIYEATSHPTGRDFYGEGKSYNVFAGCDSTIALARVKIDKELCNRFDWNCLTAAEKKVLADWINKFRSKYTYVGRLSEAEGHHLDLSEFDCPPTF